ncbi:MAG: imelysin family protein [Pseudomonadales bacterium]|nr:imelysin family protein [Pseudomonadales bacterium]
MKRLASVILFVLLSACAKPEPEQQLINDMAYKVIIPAHDAFLSSAKNLTRRSQQLCENPQSAQVLEETRSAWLQAMLDWQVLKMINFGPVTNDNMAWKIQFWPDKKNLVRSKAEALLSSDQVLTLETMEAQSVTIQGLTAIEYLLFDEQGAVKLSGTTDKAEARRCQLLFVTARHTEKVANGLHHAWVKEGYVKTFLSPGEKNPVYTDPAQLMGQLLGALVANLEQVKKYNLESPMGLGGTKAKANPYLNEAWRSRYSKELLIARINGLHDLYRGGQGYGFDDYLRAKPGHKELNDSLDAHFLKAVSALESLDKPLFDEVQGHSDTLQRVLVEISALLSETRYGVTQAAGVTLGFNANDGD